MATETKTFYPGAYDLSDYSYASISGATNPVGKGSNNTGNFATINLKTGSRAATHTRWPFNCSSIPVGATIDSVSCKVAAQASSTSSSYVPTRTLQLHSGTTAKGSATTISSTNRSVYTLSCGTWTRSELQSCNLYIYAQRGTSSTSTSRSIQFYGADLVVQYTYQSEKFMLKLTGSWNDVARVFKKVSGIWVEQTDLANVIEDGVRYQNGGEIISPNKTVILGFSGHSDRAYVTIDGVKYYNKRQNISVPAGTVITATSKGSDTDSAGIYVDGELVKLGTNVTHSITVNSNTVVMLGYSGSGSSYYSSYVEFLTGAGENIIVLSISGYDYAAYQGMTWAEWCNSEHFAGGFAIQNNRVVLVSDGQVFGYIENATPNETITDGTAYTITYT